MPRKYSASLALAVAAITTLAPASALWSCARKDAAKPAATIAQEAANAPSPPGPQVLPGAPGSQPSIPPPPLGAIRPGPDRPEARPAAPSSPPQPPMAASIRGFGLGVGSKPRIPSDFSLGPLESARPAAKDERAALTTAQAFMKCLAEGKLDPSLLLPEAQDALAALLAPRPSASGAAAPSSQSAAGSGSDRQPGQPAPKKAEAPSPRLGAIAIHGDDASLRVRLPSDPQSPRQEGLLSLRRVADAWYVEALSLDPPSSEALAFSPDPGAQAR